MKRRQCRVAVIDLNSSQHVDFQAAHFKEAPCTNEQTFGPRQPSCMQFDCCSGISICLGESEPLNSQEASVAEFEVDQSLTSSHCCTIVLVEEADVGGSEYLVVNEESQKCDLTQDIEQYRVAVTNEENHMNHPNFQDRHAVVLTLITKY